MAPSPRPGSATWRYRRMWCPRSSTTYLNTLDWNGIRSCFPPRLGSTYSHRRCTGISIGHGRRRSRPTYGSTTCGHSGAVLAAQTGATLAELMARLGHSTSQAAMRYQHASKGRDKHIAALLSKLAGADKPAGGVGLARFGCPVNDVPARPA